MGQNAARPATRWPVYLVIALLVVVTLVFVIEFVTTTASEIAAQAEATPELTASLYADEVAAVLKEADAQRGSALVEQYGCVVCHRLANNKIAPPFEGIAERGATRRAPLSASAYIYESILHPLAFVVEGYNPAMPQNFRERLTDAELGDIIAYLLTPDAH